MLKGHNSIVSTLVKYFFFPIAIKDLKFVQFRDFTSLGENEDVGLGVRFTHIGFYRSDFTQYNTPLLLTGPVSFFFSPPHSNYHHTCM